VRGGRPESNLTLQGKPNTHAWNTNRAFRSNCFPHIPGYGSGPPQATDKWCLKHFCSEFITWMIYMILIAKHAHLYRCNQGIMTKCSNSECNARYITMNVMHCWDVWLHWWCIMRMRDPMHDRDDAYDTMQLPWCWPNDAYTMMQGWWCLWCMHIINA
jgi:hypothetical protein